MVGDYMEFFNTKNNIPISGACSKVLVRTSDGTLAVKKERYSDVSHDYESELMIKSLADYVGIPCCDVLVSDGKLYSIFDKSFIKKIELNDLDDVNTDVNSLFKCVARHSNSNKDILNKLSNIIVFDLITRQLDRNFTNIAFIKDDRGIICDIYPLYDNGLSLFSAVPFNKEVYYTSVLGKFDEVLEKCLEYDLSSILSWNITESTLNDLWKDIPDTLISGISKNNIISWVATEYKFIVDKVQYNLDLKVNQINRLKTESLQK